MSRQPMAEVHLRNAIERGLPIPPQEKHRVAEIQAKMNEESSSPPAASAESSGNASLNENQKQVLRNVISSQVPQGKNRAPQTQAKPRAGDFMALVDAHHQKHGGKRSESIAAVAASNPEMHMAWLQAQQTSGPAPKTETSGQKAEQHDFMAEARRISAGQSMPLSKAMAEVARRDPALHQRFLQDVQ